jgi:GNAT superfamily N-acetyltransferase
MNYKVKVLSDSLPFDEIGKLFQKTYIEPYYDTGGLDWSEKYAKWFLPAFYPDKTFFYSTWVGSELVATLFGNPVEIVIDNSVELKTISLSLAATHQDHRNRGLQKNMIKQLIDKARGLSFDLVYGMPEKKKGGALLKNYFDFTCFQKKDKHRIKPMEDYGIKEFKEKRGMNPLLAKLAGIYAKIPQNKVERGVIRDGKMDDLASVVAIYNGYRKLLPLSVKLSKNRLEYEIKNYFNNLRELGPHFHPEWKVWEEGNEILASLLIRYEAALFKNGSIPVALFWNLGYREGLSIDERTAFLAEVLQYIRKTYPEVGVCQTTMAANEIKVYDNLKFADDQVNYELWALPLTAQGEEINRYPKYKEFFIMYYR